MASWSNEETFKFIELYKNEAAIWNPKSKNHKDKNKVNDAWERIADSMNYSVVDIKKKKEALMASFRMNQKRVINSQKSGDVFKPIWMYYDVMAAFLSDLYSTSKSTKDLDNTIYQDTAFPEMEVSNVEVMDSDVVEGYTISLQKPYTKQLTKSHQPCKQVNEVLSTLSSVLSEKFKQDEEDECDLYCRLLAKKLKRFEENDRQELMYEIDGLLLQKRKSSSNRRYDAFSTEINTCTEYHQSSENISTEEIIT